jgi:3' terminal RNA ribose 2'-O-methyltransferase Hen1
MTTWLHEQRLEAVLAAIRECGAESILDLGCGDGALLIRLAREPKVSRIVGIDLSSDSLAQLRKKLEPLPVEYREKVELIHGSISESQRVLAGFDAAVLVETIEHIDPDRLSMIEHRVFHDMRPETVVITTPNSDFNSLLGVPQHRHRHPDHRFEWGRAKFRSWAEGVAERNGYAVTCRDVAGAHPVHGGASQMALLMRGRTAGKHAWPSLNRPIAVI